ncbi:MAG: neutral/alkaline non-lysosomal ceramidase N-terminal domain-containing protein [Gemmataceae bacterium]|nr:neutral/alkaline non-lysosomal ceramidase N-terminal domain-containing protein [Gemmataceae bacterium]
MSRWIVSLACVAVFAARSPAQEPAPGGWKAGAASVVITPKTSMWMSGYGSRDKPAEGKLHDLWAKALALQDAAGRRTVLVTLDLVGIDRDLSVAICRDLKAKYGLPRAAVVLSVSHTHTGPVVGTNLNAMYFLDAKQQQYVADYTKELHANVVRVVGEALGKLAPARLSWGTGRATFAVNRRNNKEADVSKIRAAGKLKGPIDHDVPVLAVRGAKGQLRAVVFGYACHATVLGFYQWSGDYPGFAQLELEKVHPGAVALFWAGCGADQNPLPRRTVALAENYGKQLADAVNAVLKTKLAPVVGPLTAAYTEIDLPFADLPTREQLVKDSLGGNKFVVNRARLLLKELNEKRSLRGTYPYPVQAWQLGYGPTLVTLGGEVVVDYALRLKKELGADRTWAMGYANDVMAYIPSLRVLKEGGYEGGGSMVYYGLPTVWSPRVEELIVAAVHTQVKQVRRGQ